MTTRTSDESQIKNYLLGELDDDEAARLEEEFFSDDESFAEFQAIEMALVDGYVRNHMPADERHLFETNYLATPERRARVSEAGIFHNELEDLRPAATTTKETYGWIERIFGGWNLSMPAVQYAGAALILVLALSAGWLIYDGLRTRNELMLARNSLANSETSLNERLAQREKELSDKLAELRGEDSESLSALQGEVDTLRQQLTEARRKNSEANTPSTQTPTIATILLPVGRGGVNPIATVRMTRETKVLNIRITVAAGDGDTFDVRIDHAGDTLMKTSGIKTIINAGGRIVSVSIPARQLTEGNYDVILHGQTGSEKTRSFLVAFK